MVKSMVKWKSDVGPGWHAIVEKAVNEIEDKNGYITQVKEKFGGLRIYTQGGDREAIDDTIRLAEKVADMTCEECGADGSVRDNNGWLKTLCSACNAKRI